MGRYRQHITSLNKRTQDKISFVFAGEDGYPVDIILRTPSDNKETIDNLKAGGDPNNLAKELERSGDDFDPNATIKDTWKKCLEKDINNQFNGVVLDSTVAEWERLDAEIRTLTQITSPTTDQQNQIRTKTEARRDIEKHLKKTIRSSADISQWAHHYFRAVAAQMVHEQSLGTVTQETKTIFDSALKACLLLFPRVTLDPSITPPNSAQITPVRWAFSKRLGDLYRFNPNEKGFFAPTHTDTNSYVRTDLSREGICRPIFALWDLYRASPDQSSKDKIKGIVFSILEDFRVNEFKAFHSPKSSVFFSKSTQLSHLLENPPETSEILNDVPKDVRLLFARQILPFIPYFKQIDALFGGDHMFVYTLLRIGGEMGLVSGPTGYFGNRTYTNIADEYFREHKKSFPITTTGMYFQLAEQTLQRALSNMLSDVSDRAGNILLTILSFVVLLITLILNLLFPGLGTAASSTALLLLPVTIWIRLVIMDANVQAEVLTFDKLYETIALESDILSMLILLDKNRPENHQLWETKMSEILTLERNKIDALYQAYYSTTNVGKNVLSMNLNDMKQTVERLQNEMKSASSSFDPQKLAHATGAYLAARQTLEFAYKFQHNVWKEVPERLIRANYGHAYGTNFVSYITERKIGSVKRKIDYLNRSVYPLNLGNSSTGLSIETKQGILVPQSFPLVSRMTDLGDIIKLVVGIPPEEEFKHLEVIGSEFWHNRTSILKHNPYKYPNKDNGLTAKEIDWAVGEFRLCLTKFLENGYDIVKTVDDLNP